MTPARLGEERPQFSIACKIAADVAVLGHLEARGKGFGEDRAAMRRQSGDLALMKNRAEPDSAGDVLIRARDAVVAVRLKQGRRVVAVQTCQPPLLENSPAVVGVVTRCVGG